MKPTSTYKMPKTEKVRLTRYHDPHMRGDMKRSIIQAHLFASSTKPKSKKEKDTE